jgi:hypothetical protein
VRREFSEVIVGLCQDGGRRERDGEAVVVGAVAHRRGERCDIARAMLGGLSCDRREMGIWAGGLRGGRDPDLRIASCCEASLSEVSRVAARVSSGPVWMASDIGMDFEQ